MCQEDELEIQSEDEYLESEYDERMDAEYDAYFAQYDDDPNPYFGTYSEE